MRSSIPTREWGEETLAVVFSATKGVTVICIHHLAESGAVELDAPVASYWPAFAAEGKENGARRRHCGSSAESALADSSC